jgi:spore germination protein GerM
MRLPWVFLSVEGQSIDREHPLGGEGLILRQPITRTQFDADFLLNP